MGNELFIGIDGGASKTAGAAIDAAGRVVACCRAAGSAVVGAPSAHACGVLAGAMGELCSRAGASRGDIAHVALGLNGVDFADEHATQHAALAAALALPPQQLTLVNDAIVALWGATASPAAAMLQHGSGFTAAFRAAHGKEQLFDHLSVGLSFDIRRDAVVTVARMLDGRAEMTPLCGRVLEFFGVRAEDYCEAVFRERVDPQRSAQIAAVVFEAWLDGDAAAAALVERAADEYALAAKAMVARTGCETAEAAFGGGVIAQAPREFWTLLARRVADHTPHAVTRSPALPPELGAAIMAGFQCGQAPAELFDAVCRSAATSERSGARRGGL